MDWIHCNGCYVQPGENSDRKFSITSCGHIYCGECLKSVVSQKCGVCSSKFTTVQLTAKMKSDVQEFFRPPDEVLSKLVQVLAFQNGHRMRMTAHHKTVAQKYKAAKQEIKRLHDIIRSLQKKVSILENVGELRKVSPGQSLSPNLSPKGLNISNASMSNQSPTPRVLMTPNRLTLQRQVTSKNINSPISPQGFNVASLTPVNTSMNKTSTPLTEIAYQMSQRSNSQRISPQFLSPNTQISPVQAVGVYRTPKQYSSQPSTPESPRTPSTPAKSPAMPESAHRFYSQIYRASNKEVEKRMPSSSMRSGHSQQQHMMSALSPYSLMRKNLSLH